MSLRLAASVTSISGISNAVREALKKPLFVPHVGVHQCCIANYGPSSSPMGHLAAVLNW